MPGTNSPPPSEEEFLGKTMSRAAAPSTTITVRICFSLYSQAESMAAVDGENVIDWIEGAVRARLAHGDITDPRGNRAAGGSTRR